MADCRACGAEVHGIGCPACEPAVDVRAIAAIEATPRWAEARRHRTSARTAPVAIGFGLALAAMGGGFALLGGAAVVVGLVVAAGGLAVVGVGAWQLRQPLRRWPAIVLTTTHSVSHNSDGRRTDYYAVVARDRDGASHRLGATARQVEGLEPGQAIIAFTRGDRLDDVWSVPTPDVAGTPAQPEVSGAIAALAAADLDAVAEAEDRRIRRPLRAFRGPLIAGGVAVVVALAPVAASVLAPGDAATREVLWTVGLTVGALIILLALILTAEVLRTPVARHLVVLLDDPRGTDAIVLDTVDRRGQRRRWPTTRAVRDDAPRGVPVLVCTLGSDAIAVQVLDPRGAPRAADAPP